MRKVFSLLLLFGMVFAFSITNTASAEEFTEEQVLFEATEITDLNALYQRATSEINEDNETVALDDNIPIVELTGSLSEVSFKPLSTTQLLKSVQMSDGSIVNSYATYSFADIDGIELSASSRQDDSNMDSSLGVRAYSSVYYTLPMGDGVKHKKITKATGGWSVKDSKLSVVNKNARIGASGPTRWGGDARAVDQRRDYTNISDSSWTFTANPYDSWVPVLNSSRASIGTYTWATIKGYGDTWSIKHYNNR